VSEQALTTRDRRAAATAAAAGASPVVTRTPAPSFAEVFEAYAAYVLRLLTRLRVADADVQDVAQEVFLAIAQGLPRFEGRSALKTWVCGICLRKASDHHRRLGRRRETVKDCEQVDPTEPLAELLRKEDARLLDAALASLSEKQLQVFVLYEIEELEMAEVARALGCPRFTAYTRLRDARARVREFFIRGKGGKER
jgi:RNA polymerase sigma-70 factor (ECF subfamily)